MSNAIDSPHYDQALAVAIVLLEMFDRSAGDPKPILLSKTTFLILEAIREAKPVPPGLFQPSRN